MSIERFTDKSYWDELYRDRLQTPLEMEGYRNYTYKMVYASLLHMDLDGKSVLEIGAGDSQWITFLAKRHPTCCATGLDYSELGCDELEVRAKNENVSISVICADLFDPPAELLGAFDVVYSMGVVEHFDNLDEVVRQKVKFLKPGGQVYSLIPNMSGLIGKLTKLWNPAVYEIHNPHDLSDLIDGHEKADLVVKQASYIRSNEFGVLSSCLTEETGALTRFIYVWLCRFSKFTAIFEMKVQVLPKTKFVSPLMFCIAQKN